MTKYSVTLFTISLIVVSLVGGYIGVKGNRVPIKNWPTQTYEDVNFISHANDHLPLDGWYFPATGPKTIVIVHGWGGNRGRLLYLAEYFQRNGVNTLTFDLRGGTGRNSYGQQESGDLESAVEWLTTAKKLDPANLTIVGVSMGGAASILYASDHPIDTLVLLSPMTDISEVKKLALRNRHFILPQVYAAGATFIEWAVYNVRPVNPRSVVSKITAPTLIFHAEDDDIVPVTSTRAVEAEVKARNQTNITFEYLPTGGHKYIDNDPPLDFPFGKRIINFINQ